MSNVSADVTGRDNDFFQSAHSGIVDYVFTTSVTAFISTTTRGSDIDSIEVVLGHSDEVRTEIIENSKILLSFLFTRSQSKQIEDRFLSIVT